MTQQPKATNTHKTIRVNITMQEVINFQNAWQGNPSDISHRDLVAAKFLKAGYVVTNFAELKYFARPWGCMVEGETNKSLLSK